jgi:5'-deoxynucleotidase YfbR-like HD superfamily hydrolase
MCLIHDLAECIVGDLTPSDMVSKEEKRCRERVIFNIFFCNFIELIFIRQQFYR